MNIKIAIVISAVLFCGAGAAKAQERETILKIKEDYTSPNGRLWEKSSKWVDRKIEEGIYKAESLDNSVAAELTFGNNIEQRNCSYDNEVEFKLLKLKGKPGDFIGVRFSIRELTGIKHKREQFSSDDFSRKEFTFLYNNPGVWKVYEGNFTAQSSPSSTGNAVVNEQANTIKLMHTPTATVVFLNGVEIYTIRTQKMAQLQWKDIKLTAEQSKTKIGLDDAMFTGYFDVNNDPITADDLFGLSVTTLENINGFAVKNSSETKYRFMDDYGRTKGNARFDEIKPDQSRGSMILVKDNGKFGYLDQQGNWAIPAEYAEATDKECTEDNADCLKGYYKVKKDNEQNYFVNAEGKITDGKNAEKQLAVGEAQDDSNTSSANQEIFQFTDEKTGLIGFKNKKNEVVIAPKFSYVYDFIAGYAIAAREYGLYTRHGVIDSAGKQVIDMKYDAITEVNFERTQIYYAKLNNKWGVIDKTGKTLVECKYDETGVLNDSLIRVTLNGKSGYVDITGKVIIPIVYEKAEAFEEGKAEVVLNGRRFRIDKKGKEIP